MAQLCVARTGMPLYVQSPAVFPHMLPGNVEDQFRKEKCLGSGSSSRVYKVYDKMTKIPYACKVLSKRNTNFNAQSVRQEVRIMLKLSGRLNIVNLLRVFENSDYVFLVMDLCPGGDLLDFIAGQHPAGCSEGLVAHVMVQIMAAIQSCHAVGVMHGDVKPENIMISESNTNGPLVKLIDFGLSQVMNGEKVTTIAGTPCYMAPEVFQGSYSREADIWSAGCIMYMLFTGEQPFHIEGEDIAWNSAQRKQLREHEQLKQDLPSFGPWKSMSESARDVLFKMLTMDPSARLTADEFLQHPWALQHMRQLQKE